MATPTYIYKIVPSSAPPPSPLPDALPVSDLDKADNFIHLSTALQIPGTLKRFFGNVEQVYILRITYSQVESKIKWENSKGTGTSPWFEFYLIELPFDWKLLAV